MQNIYTLSRSLYEMIETHHMHSLEIIRKNFWSLYQEFLVQYLLYLYYSYFDGNIMSIHPNHLRPSCVSILFENFY